MLCKLLGIACIADILLRKTRSKILSSSVDSDFAPQNKEENPLLLQRHMLCRHSRHFPSENKEDYLMGTVVTGAVVVVIVGLIIRSMVRDKKNGKSIQCGGDCKNCGGHCH